jgi:hypothetical protein
MDIQNDIPFASRSATESNSGEGSDSKDGRRIHGCGARESTASRGIAVGDVGMIVFNLSTDRSFDEMLDSAIILSSPFKS